MAQLYVSTPHAHNVTGDEITWTLARRDVQHAVSYLRAASHNTLWTHDELMFHFAVAGLCRVTFESSQQVYVGELLELGGNLMVHAKTQQPHKGKFAVDSLTVAFKVRQNVDDIMKEIATAAR
jgi:hypothetical protein